jgi:hypothetical protein
MIENITKDKGCSERLLAQRKVSSGAAVLQRFQHGEALKIY